MPLVDARRRVVALRQPRRAYRIARALWVAWAVIVWNVVFDHVITSAARQFVHAAGVAAKNGGPYARMDDWMRPAVPRAAWIATAAGAAILGIGFIAARAARNSGGV